MVLPFPKAAATITNLSNMDDLTVCLGPLKLKLEQVQTRLNQCGVTSLIVKLITSTQHDTVMLETVKLAVAMLKGGHRGVQVSRERERGEEGETGREEREGGGGGGKGHVREGEGERGGRRERERKSGRGRGRKEGEMEREEGKEIGG